MESCREKDEEELRTESDGQGQDHHQKERQFGFERKVNPLSIRTLVYRQHALCLPGS